MLKYIGPIKQVLMLWKDYELVHLSFKQSASQYEGGDVQEENSVSPLPAVENTTSRDPERTNESDQECFSLERGEYSHKVSMKLEN